MNKERLTETLAAYSHEAWSGWMRYILDKCLSGNSRMFVIPNNLAADLMLRSHTSYALLPEDEKRSDREQAEKIIAILEADAEQTRAEIAAQLTRAMREHGNEY